MSSEKEMPKSTVPSGDGNGFSEVEQQGNAAQVYPVRPLSQTSFSSPSTEVDPLYGDTSDAEELLILA